MAKLKQTMIVVLGHVDHGKSTLLGRLLADTHSLPEGKLKQVQAYCQGQSKQFEYAYVLDALKTERTQGITLDTARTYIKTKKSWLTIIDVPGHVELIRNMVSGADRAEYGLLVIDAKRGLQENTKKHCYLAHFLGIKKIIVCFNKMDKVAYSEKIYAALVKEIEKYTENVGIRILANVPVSARHGVNIVSHAQQMPWYKGKSVLALLDGLLPQQKKKLGYFRFPVQDAYALATKNMIAGTVTSGVCVRGEQVLLLPACQKTKITSIEQWPHKKQKAVAGTAVGLTLKLKQDARIHAGDMLCHPKYPCQVGSRFSVLLLWAGKKTVQKNKQYVIQTLTTKVTGEILKMEKKMYDVVVCTLAVNKRIAVDVYADYPETGRITIIEEGHIVGVGLITKLMKE